MKRTLLILAVVFTTSVFAQTSTKSKIVEMNDTIVEFFIEGFDSLGRVSIPNYGTIYFNVHRWEPQAKLVFPKTKHQIRCFVLFMKNEYEIFGYRMKDRWNGRYIQDSLEEGEDFFWGDGEIIDKEEERSLLLLKRIKKIIPWRKNFELLYEWR